MIDKGWFTAQPLIDNDGEGILIASVNSSLLNLFGGHIGRCANNLLLRQRFGAVSHEGNAKVAHLHTSILRHQKIGGLDITMNDALIVGILQCCCDLAYVGHDGWQWECCATWMQLIERASGGVGHDEVGDVAFNTE